MNPMNRAFVALQHVLPQRLLSDAIYAATRWRFGPWKNTMIRVLSRFYDIDLDEPVRRAPHDFVHFADFFTRELKEGARTIDAAPEAISCPADGRISAMGPIEGDQIFQAKGHSYGLAALLGTDDGSADRFADGDFMTVYLAPSNYHRVHMPVSGRLIETRYVPGRLFSVSPATVDRIPGLFARNERLVCLFETPAGQVAVILVGAMLVSSIETVWSGEEQHSQTARWTDQRDAGIEIARGDELGRFNMGSTVILLFENNRARLGKRAADTPVQMGDTIGSLRKPSDSAES